MENRINTFVCRSESLYSKSTNRVYRIAEVLWSEIVASLVFPQQPAHCRKCDRPARRAIVGQNSGNNWNRGRPYYHCVHHFGRDEGWVCWDDDIGRASTNPQCRCGSISRQDKMGMESGRPGLGFWTCSEGTCDYYSADINGGEGSLQIQLFTPWLL